MSNEISIQKNILSLADKYDTFFVDVYGVLYNGTVLYDGVLNTMEKLKNMGKKIIIVSNTTQISEDAKRGYEQRGMIQGVHYDEFVTSGECLRNHLITKGQELISHLGINTLSVNCLFMGNPNVFTDSPLVETKIFDEAEILYVGVPRLSQGSVRIDNLLDENDNPVKIEDVLGCDWHKLHDSQGRKGPEQFAIVLEKCLRKKKILLLANPDIFAYESEGISSNKVVPIFSQGILGRYYEKLGGKVAHFGKPYRGIFEFAKQFAAPDAKIAMIGDTPWTDVIGANNFGIDSIMVMTGVTGEFIADESLPIDERFERLFGEISSKLSSVSGSNRPTHIIEQFAEE